MKLIFLLIALSFLIGIIQFGLMAVAFDKLGLSPMAAYLLLISSLFGSFFNLPLFKIHCDLPRPGVIPIPGMLWRQPQLSFTGYTVIALNVGGGLIPVLFSLYLMAHHSLPLLDTVLGISAIAFLSHAFSRPLPGIGIAMPIFIAPLSAALVALVINPALSAPLAYICGTLGVLIGADLIRLNDIRQLGMPFAAIGGAGTFDGIFITGIVAVLLA